MISSLFVSAFLATVMAQSTDNSPLTTVTLAASDILPAASSTTFLPTITNTNSPVTTITLASGAILGALGVSTSVGTSVGTSPVTSAIASTFTSAAGSTTTIPSVIYTSTFTSNICTQCSSSPAGAGVKAASTQTTLIPYPSGSSSNATSSGVPLGGSASFPVQQGSANGTIYTGAGNMLSAGSMAISASVLAASYFAFVL